MAFTGQTAEASLGDGWTSAVHHDDAPGATARCDEAVVRGEPFSSEHRIRRHDGEWRWMLVSAAPVRDPGGAIVEWFGMCLDVTDRKNAEEALREADLKRDEFLATLAHELRNPLAPLHSCLEIIKGAKGASTAFSSRRTRRKARRAAGTTTCPSP